MVKASAPVALTTSAAAPVSATATAVCKNAVVNSPPVAAKPANIRR